MRRTAHISSNRPRLGLALSGGAARGLAHVGVLKVFEEHGVRFDCVAGTSAGALVGGALAAGMPVGEIEQIGRTLRWRDLGRMTVSRLGVQTNAALEQYVRERFPVSRFEELPTPFAAVATDLQTGAAVVMRDEGDLGFAIRASCAIPGWYVPVTDEKGRQLVDGGLVANLPVSVVRALGAEVVVAVDVNSEGAKFMGPPASVLGVLLQSMLVVQRTAAQHQRQLADVVLSPAVGHMRWDEMTRADEFIDAGVEAARDAMPAIKELLEPQPEDEPGWFNFRRPRARQPAKD
ncbi:MAG: patatin-like phospholipase family protein [Acidobacteria bacterium]|nr:patatin-like phospholipase family protein [Acidobacteriota bacterium]